MSLSLHARKRLQQRGIAEKFVDVIMDYGTVRHTYGGSEVIYLRRPDQRMIRGEFGTAGLPGHCQNAYLVISKDGCVITAGHLHRKIHHH